MQDKIYVTKDEFVNCSYDEIEKRELLRCLIDKFRLQNPGKSDKELSVEWDKVRHDTVKWNELVKKVLK